jgi:predicted small secreted protein
VSIINIKYKIKEMIKKSMKMMSVVFAASMLLTSCYSYTSVVGTGAQGNNETTNWNHYVLYGLAPVAVSDSKEMTGGAENYTVYTRQSFVNGFISAITGGIYTPTTTTVTK